MARPCSGPASRLTLGQSTGLTGGGSRSGWSRSSAPAAWRVPHPATEAVLAAIGAECPDKAVAEAARKALFEHRRAGCGPRSSAGQGLEGRTTSRSVAAKSSPVQSTGLVVLIARL